MQNDNNNKKSTNWYADKPELAAERNRRRNEKYKSDPNYQVKIKTQQRQRYRKDNEFISDKAVLESNLEERIAKFGQKKLVYFGEELVECATFKTTSLSDVLGITYPSMQSYFRLGMIPRAAIEYATNNNGYPRKNIRTRVYLEEEVRIIGAILAKNFAKNLHFNEENADVISDINERISEFRLKFASEGRNILNTCSKS